MRFPKTLLASALLVTLAAGCTDVPEDTEVWEPKGVMKGTVTYMGPLPCSENGHVVGNAVLTLFNVNALPPPTGLGLSAHRIAVVPGDVLFAGVAHKIPVGENGARACPDPNEIVQVSAAWEVGPVDPGKYQVRGWFDYDGDWHAAFKFANMITKGDVGGGAVSNITEALAGGPTRYTEIEVGYRNDDDTYRIPEDGIVVDNVSPILAVQIPTNRPYFHVSEFRPGGVDIDPIANPSDEQIMMPADYQLNNANPVQVHDSLYWMMFQSGLPEAEVGPAVIAPFYFHLEDPFLLQRYDADKNGVIDTADHITGTTLPVAALGPIISLTKLDRENDTKNLWRTTQDVPRVLTSLVVTPPDAPSLLALTNVYCSKPEFPTCAAGKCCADATGTTCDDTSTCYDTPVPSAAIKAYIRPSAVCIEDATDYNSKTVIVTPHLRDVMDANNVIGDEPATINDIALQLSRNVDTTVIEYGCLPPGKFALNVIYPATGQAWTLPNESGICMPGEAPGDGTCGQRMLLPSQFRTLDIGPASDPAYCNAQRKGLDEEDLIRDYCLTEKERAMYIEGTLWGGDPDPL